MSLKEKFFTKYKIVLPKWMLELSGKTYICKRPMFVQYYPEHHKVVGKEVRLILNSLEPGDILLRRYDGYLNSIFTPGFWGHAAIAVTKDSIIHSVSEGVVEEDILEFSRCDSLCILRVKDEFKHMIPKAIELAYQFRDQHFEYDYRFERGNNKVYCTELVDSCYEGLFVHEYSEELGNSLLTPGHMFCSNHVDKILVLKH